MTLLISSGNAGICTTSFHLTSLMSHSLGSTYPFTANSSCRRRRRTPAAYVTNSSRGVVAAAVLRIRSMIRALRIFTRPRTSFLSKYALLMNSSKLVIHRFLVKARQKRVSAWMNELY